MSYKIRARTKTSVPEKKYELFTEKGKLHMYHCAKPLHTGLHFIYTTTIHALFTPCSKFCQYQAFTLNVTQYGNHAINQIFKMATTKQGNQTKILTCIKP